MIVEPPVNAVCRLRRQTALRFSPKAKYGKRSGAGLVTSLMRHSVTKLREATRRTAKEAADVVPIPTAPTNHPHCPE